MQRVKSITNANANLLYWIDAQPERRCSSSPNCVDWLNCRRLVWLDSSWAERQDNHNVELWVLSRPPFCGCRVARWVIPETNRCWNWARSSACPSLANDTQDSFENFQFRKQCGLNGPWIHAPVLNSCLFSPSCSEPAFHKWSENGPKTVSANWIYFDLTWIYLTSI